MTDTGQIPAEGLPENAGDGAAPAPAQGPEAQHGAPAPGAHQDPSAPRRPQDDLLLMPAAQGAWNDTQQSPAPGYGEPAPHAAHGDPVFQTAHGASDPGAAPTAGNEYAGLAQPGEPASPEPGAGPAAAESAQERPSGARPAPVRRPLHMGPPVPDASSSLVRSLSDRGPAGAPVRSGAPAAPAPAAATPGPGHPDAPVDDPTLLGPQLGALPPDDGGAWAHQPGPEAAYGSFDVPQDPAAAAGAQAGVSTPVADGAVVYATAGAGPMAADGAAQGLVPTAQTGDFPAQGMDVARTEDAGYAGEDARVAGIAGDGGYAGEGWREGAVADDGPGRMGDADREGVAPYPYAPDGGAARFSADPDTAGHLVHAGAGSNGHGVPDESGAPVYAHDAAARQHAYPAAAQHLAAEPAHAQSDGAPQAYAEEAADGAFATRRQPVPEYSDFSAHAHSDGGPQPGAFPDASGQFAVAPGSGVSQPVGEFVPVEGSVPTTPHLAPTPPHALTIPQPSLDGTHPAPADIAPDQQRTYSGADGAPMPDGPGAGRAGAPDDGYFGAAPAESGAPTESAAYAEPGTGGGLVGDQATGAAPGTDGWDAAVPVAQDAAAGTPAHGTEAAAAPGDTDAPQGHTDAPHEQPAVAHAAAEAHDPGAATVPAPRDGEQNRAPSFGTMPAQRVAPAGDEASAETVASDAPGAAESPRDGAQPGQPAPQDEGDAADASGEVALLQSAEDVATVQDTEAGQSRVREGGQRGTDDDGVVAGDEARADTEPAASTSEPAPEPAEEAATPEAAGAPGEPGTQEESGPPVQDPAAEAADAAGDERAGAARGSAEEDAAPGGVPASGYDEAERAAVLRVMRERRDIRNGFRNDPIPHEVLLRVLEAAHTAPSVGHSQPWDFVVIRSEDTRRTMHELAVRQREAYAKSLPKGRAKQFRELKIEAILDTPVNIVVTADPTRGGRHTLGRHTQPQMAPYSSALAVENLWLAARAEGLGVGWVSFFDEREMVRALGLPEHLDVVAYLCVGYVDEFPDEPELMQAGWSKRRPLSWVVHEEAYGRRALPGSEPHDLLAETLAGIRPLDAKALGEAWERQKRMTKPAGSLGMLEIISAQLSGLSRMCPPPVPEPAAVAIFAGDHGVHAQGVSSWPQEVTGQMVANFLNGGAVCNAFAAQVGAEVCVIDVGVACDLPATPGLLPRKVRAGTNDMTTGPALTRDEVKAAIGVGIETARDLVAAGNKALLTGEMGIANTTVSAALVAAFTGAEPAEVTGRGTGVNDETLALKTDVVRRALELHQPDPSDPIGVLAAIGGLEHAAMVGLLLGGASLRTPVVLDGVSAGAAALVARAIAPEVLAACIAGHRSAEPGHVVALTKLGLRPLVDLDLRLGEGTGALLALPLVQSAARAMHEVATFDSAGVTEK